MDARFEVTSSLRTAPDALAQLPLATIAWRALRSEHQQRAHDKEQEISYLKKLQEALICIADQAIDLKKQSSGINTDATDPSIATKMALAANAILQVLLAAGLTVVAPEGEEYSGDIAEVLDNCAQVLGNIGDVPRVAQVMVPAILQDGRILRMGKAIIAIAPADATPDSGATE